MATASVSVSFEATSMDDAEAKMAGWSLHEGCQVSVHIIEGVKSSTGVIGPDGHLVPSEMSEKPSTKEK